MTTTTHNLTTVAELAIAMPAALSVLDHLGIDYCCNGQRSVMDACASRGITMDELLALIETEPKPAGEHSWASADMSEMIRFIVDTHHRFTRNTLRSELETEAFRRAFTSGFGWSTTTFLWNR